MKKTGKIVAVHGVDGDVVIAHQISNQEKIHALTEFLVEIWTDSYIPFFIEKIKSSAGEEVILKFEEINSREEAKKLLNKNVYVFKDDEIKTHSVQEWDFLLDYKLFNQHNEYLSTIHEVVENNMQILISLQYSGKTILLPLHDSLILNIDNENKELTMQVADGLLDIL